ncbi:high frequency lysogenization protein HflD [Luminiphilus syltensis]|uniref:high frequency lysogenization protein HflD n=1 Tax=Luminiphilus syltensis TaxID=1341119 RepID=UPI00058C6992|nr:high frequency lysogenization protein HflD [Luminiphilus syltensis]
MAHTPLEDQTIALAGVAQAARIVDQCSRSGSYPTAFLEASIHSLFSFDTPSVAAVYGNLQGVKLGLQTLSAGLGTDNSHQTVTTMRYLFAILHLSRQFEKRPEMQQIIHTRLQHAQYKANHFSNDINGICHNISAVYQDTLSTLSFRIKVTGSAQHLQNEANADIIRALLLAGVRSAYLWRQLGGRRWKLALQRGQLRDTAHQLSRDMGLD